MTQLVQALVNGVMTGALIAIPAIGFSAIFAVLRYPNFAIASYATIGAFAGWWADIALGLPVVAMLAVAFLVAGVVGVAAEELALKRLRPSGALTVAIASLALNLILENLVRFAFGNDLRGYDLPIQRDWRILDIRLGPQQVENFAVAVLAMAAVFLFLAFTRTGKAMRAVADNPMLADIKGINADMVGRLASFVGMGAHA